MKYLYLEKYMDIFFPGTQWKGNSRLSLSSYFTYWALWGFPWGTPPQESITAIAFLPGRPPGHTDFDCCVTHSALSTISQNPSHTQAMGSVIQPSQVSTRRPVSQKIDPSAFYKSKHPYKKHIAGWWRWWCGPIFSFIYALVLTVALACFPVTIQWVTCLPGLCCWKTPSWEKSLCTCVSPTVVTVT